MKRLLPLLALAALLAGGCALLAPRAESFGSLLARAEAGDAEAQFKVGQCYRYGDERSGVKQDYARAAAWLRKAAEQGHAQAQSEFGTMLDDGKGVEENEEEAVAWYRKSAEQGNPYGEINLACAYQSGKGGMDKDSAAAFEWMKKAADHDLPIAWFTLGTMYEAGTGVEKDGAEALRWYRKAAESDTEQARAFAQNSVGRCHHFGIGVEPDEKEALVWYLKSAEAGNPAAMDNLAQFYTTGAGGTRDLETARSWRERARAVSPDDPVFGQSVRDLLDGDRELEELRERETLTADEQFRVGSALVSGARNVFDPDEGFRLLRQAAEGGNGNAQSYLAHIYYKGLCGVEKNPAEARRFLRMLAGDDAEKQAGLGRAFYTGWRGLERDFRESAYWLCSAIENGYGGRYPKRALERLEWMKPRDYAEARIDLFAERETPDAVPPRPEGATEDAVRALAAARPGSLAERVRAELFAPHAAGPDRDAPAGPRVRGALALVAEGLAGGSLLRTPNAGAWGVFYDLTERDGADDFALRWATAVGEKRWGWDDRARAVLDALEARAAASGATPFQRLLAAQGRALVDPSGETAAAFRAAADAWRATLDPAIPAGEVDALLAGLGWSADAPPDAAKLFALPPETRGRITLWSNGFNDLADATARAEKGDVRAQGWLAEFYGTGEYGVEKDPETARKWLLRAAEGGDQWAKDFLARLKKGSSAEPEEAVRP